ncbi:hypothetical protein NDU88_008349, partial [Pleurodeles waltl]
PGPLTSIRVYSFGRKGENPDIGLSVTCECARSCQDSAACGDHHYKATATSGRNSKTAFCASLMTAHDTLPTLCTTAMTIFDAVPVPHGLLHGEWNSLLQTQ